jgi:hypothetical protein
MSGGTVGKMNAELKIDSEFEKIIPPLSEDEFRQLEANILEEGEIYTPIFTWNGLIVDGHHRYKILKEHPDIKFRVSERHFDNRYAAISWICNNQLGRRNLNDIQRTVLIGRKYEAEKLAYGDRRSESFSKGQNVLLKNTTNITAQRIGKEMGVNERTVRRAGEVVIGIDAAEAVLPGIEKEIMSGSIKPSKSSVIAVGKAPAEERKQLAEALRKPQEKLPAPKDVAESRKRNQSIEAISAALAEHKEVNDIENVLGIIHGAADDFQGTCSFYLDEFPGLLKEDKPKLIKAVKNLKSYILSITGGN